MGDLTRRAALVSGATALWCWPRQDRSALPGAQATFRLPFQAPSGQTPFRADAFIDHEPPLPYAHCPSICELSNGRMVCVWYAGSREGVRDVSIWLAESQALRQPADDGQEISWGKPRIAIDRRTALNDLDRFVNKVGNSVIFTAADGRLWLVYVTIAVGGWSGSSLNACSSIDNGKTWSRSQRLTLSPFFNISELVRSAPVILESGEVGLPIYHECVGKFPEMLWLRPGGDKGERLVASKSRMAGGRSLLQPAVVPIDGRHALAFLRNHSDRRRIGLQHSANGGQSWSTPVETPLANADASIAVVRLSGGQLLLAFNNASHTRDNLCLALAPDGIGDWQLIATLENAPGGCFAYPYMVQDSQGIVQLVYAWQMKRIRHVAVNEAWILAQPRKPLA